jgi:RHS repeat-associated protein
MTETVREKIMNKTYKKIGASVRGGHLWRGVCRLAWLWLVLSAPLAVKGQDYATAVGHPAFSTDFPVEMGVIDLSNGNLHMEIPLSDAPQRGKVPALIKLVYDSKLWKIVQAGSSFSWQPNTILASQGGWRLATPFSGRMDVNSFGEACPVNPVQNNGIPYFDFGPWTWTDPEGTAHTFFIRTRKPNTNFSTCPPTDAGIAAADAAEADSSGFHAYVTNFSNIVVYDTSGNQVFPRPTDANGNYLTAGTSTSPVTDTLGRSLVNISQNGNQTYYDVLTFQGNRARYTVTNETIPVQTNFKETLVSEFSGTMTVIQSIGFPDGTSYSFTYDAGGYGELTGITLRTGGTVSYGYSNFFDSYQNENRWITSRKVDTGTWFFSPAVITQCSSQGVGCKEKVTVTRPAINASGLTSGRSDDIVYTFTLNNGAWNSQVDYYSGPSAAARGRQGTLLATATTDFDFSSACTGCQQGVGAQYIKALRQNTILPNGKSRKVEYTYDNAASGNLTAIKEWDYYPTSAGPPAAPDRETDLTYVTDPAYLQRNLSGKVASVVVKSGTGATQAQTQFFYDETQLAELDGVQGHDDTLFPHTMLTRGNVTTVQRWLQGSGGAADRWIATHEAYDQLGNLVSRTDALRNQTLFTFDAANDYAYLTKVQSPSTNSTSSSSAAQTQHSVSMTYDFSSGLVASTTDENSQPTVFGYDTIGRPTSATLPNQAQTTTSYPDAQTVVTTRPIDSSTSRVSYSHLDAFGRPDRTAVSNGEGSFDQQDSCFDPRGELLFSSYPYQGSGLSGAKVCSGTGDSYVYDGLGRLAGVLHSDGSTASLAYNGAAVMGTDERGNSSITQYDGLARPVSVCEVSSVNFIASTTASCGQDIAGTGYLTSYQYNVLDQMLQVNQGSVAARVKQYDTLGRLTSDAIPEMGGTAAAATFGYDDSGNLIFRKRPKPNQDDAAQLVTTTYQYDALDRLLRRSYDDGATPAANYFYDETTAGGRTGSMGIGRPTSDHVEGSAANGSDLYYDAMGNVLYNDQAPPRQFGSSSGYAVAYQYNQISAPTSFTNPAAGITYSYSYNESARLTGIASSLADATHPAGLASGIHYGPFGQIKAMLGPLAETYGYDGRGRLNKQVDEGPTTATATITIGGNEQTAQVLTQPQEPGMGDVVFSGTVQSKPVSSPASTGGTSMIRISGSEKQYPDGLTAGTGTVTLSGTEQKVLLQQPAPGQGSVVFSGSLQSKVTAEATPGTGSVFINTSNGVGDGSYQIETPATAATGSVSISGRDQICGGGTCGGCAPHYLSGYIQIYINGGIVASASFGNGEDSVTMAQMLAASVSSNVVTAQASGSTIRFTATQTGTVGNGYALSTHYDGPGDPCMNPPNPNFSLTASGLGGGTDGSSTTSYDSGSCTVTVNGHTSNPTSWGQGWTASQIAGDLVGKINADGAFVVTAQQSGTALDLTAKNPGAGTNFAFSSSCSSNDAAHFNPPSFTASDSGPALTGGEDTQYSYDSGTATITVKDPSGNTDTFKSPWSGPNTTTASIAAGLVASLPNPILVNAVASGSGVSLVAKKSGATTNLNFSSSITHDSNYAQSFSLQQTPDANLTGGHDALYAYDAGSVMLQVNTNQYRYSWPDAGQDPSTVNAATIANGLANKIPPSGTSVTVTGVNGDAIGLMATVLGAIGNYPVNVTFQDSGTTIPVFGTGVASPNLLALDGTVDTHYKLINSADSTAPGPGVYVANSTASPIPPWAADGPNSKWIAPLGNAAASLQPGSYAYRTTFDLTGLDPKTALVTGQWAADDSGNILLNGVAVPSSATPGLSGLTPFTISSGFVAGVNTLDFVVTNAGSSPNPTGLRVDISGTANFAGASFAASFPATLNGGGPPPTATDAGTLTATLNGVGYAGSWNRLSTPGSVAASLTAAINSGQTVQEDSSVTAGLVSWWSADGQALDIVSGNDAAVQSGVTYAPGKVNQAFSFNGTQGYVQVGGSYSWRNSRSFAAWVYLGAVQGSGLPIFTAGTAGASDILGVSGTSGSCSSSGANHLYLDHAGSACVVSNLVLAPNAWNHVAVTFDLTNVTFYVNGTASTPQPASFYNYDLNTVTLGGNTVGGNSTQAVFNGLLDELRVYQGAMSASMVQALANNNSYTLSGQVTLNGAALPGATINLSGTILSSTTTDTNGNYSFTLPAGGHFVVTPGAPNYNYSPAAINYNNVYSNRAINFTAGLLALASVPTFEAHATANAVYIVPSPFGTAYTLSSAVTAWDQTDFASPSFQPSNSIFDWGTVQLTVGGHSDTFGWSAGDTPGSLAFNLAAKLRSDSGALVNAQAGSAPQALVASMLSQSGLGNFSASTIVGNNVNQVGWATDNSAAGSWLEVDLGTAQAIIEADIYALTPGYEGSYHVQCSDENATWTDAAIDFDPAQIGWNKQTWNSVGAHRYWRLLLENAPGAGPQLSELRLSSSNAASAVLTANAPGAASNYPYSVAVTSDKADFPTPSVAAVSIGANLTGGQDNVYTAVPDTGTITATVNENYTVTVPYGATDTASTLASALAAKFQDDLKSPVAASASQGVVTLVARRDGSAGDYPFTVAINTSLPKLFSTPSFNLGDSGSTLTGGFDVGTAFVTLYSYNHTLGADGRINSTTDSVMGGLNFGYDSLGRLSSSTGYTWDIDSVANRWHQTGAQSDQEMFDSNNHGSGANYDILGNVTYDGLSHHFTYDAENRIIAVDGGATATYAYDTHGRRIQKVTAAGTFEYVYDLAGNMVGEIGPSGSWTRAENFEGNLHIGTYTNSSGEINTYFSLSDWQETERVRTDWSGMAIESCQSQIYGDGLSCTGQDPSPVHYMGYEHDFETGLDYANARYYNPRLGRFMTADLLDGSSGAPGTFNRYAFVGNDPVNHRDPSGMSPGNFIGGGVVIAGGALCGPLAPVCIGVGILSDIFGVIGLFHHHHHPVFHGSTTPRPKTTGSVWDEKIPGSGGSLPIPGMGSIPWPGPGALWGLLAPTDPNCDFGPCGTGFPGNDLQQGAGSFPFHYYTFNCLEPGVAGPPAPGCDGFVYPTPRGAARCLAAIKEFDDAKEGVDEQWEKVGEAAQDAGAEATVAYSVGCLKSPVCLTGGLKLLGEAAELILIKAGTLVTLHVYAAAAKGLPAQWKRDYWCSPNMLKETPFGRHR